MLGNEHRMAAKRCLLTIILRYSWRETPTNQLFRLDKNALEATRLDVVALRGAEVKPPTKRRIGERREKFVQ